MTSGFGGVPGDGLALGRHMADGWRTPEEECCTTRGDMHVLSRHSMDAVARQLSRPDVADNSCNSAPTADR